MLKMSFLRLGKLTINETFWKPLKCDQKELKGDLVCVLWMINNLLWWVFVGKIEDGFIGKVLEMDKIMQLSLGGQTNIKVQMGSWILGHFKWLVI